MSGASEREQAVRRVVRHHVQALSAYAVAPVPAGAIKLDAMENPYALPPELQQGLGQALAQVAINRYPADPAALRAALRPVAGIPQDAGLLFGNGSDELIHLLVQATCEPGDVVLSPVPSFVYYEITAGLDHARFVGVDLTEQLELDLPAMLAAIKKEQPKLIFLAIPNNPTGGLWPDEAVDAILRAAPGLVVIDEAYEPFTDHSWMARVLDYPNLMVMRTMSKLGLAGLRLGYLAGHPDWTAQVDKVRPPYNLNVLTEAAARYLLQHWSVLRDQAASLVRDRAALRAGLEALPGVRCFDSEANFLLTQVPDAPGLNARLRERGVLVRYLGKAHPLLASCLRISVGTPAENDRLLKTLHELLQTP